MQPNENSVVVFGINPQMLGPFLRRRRGAQGDDCVVISRTQDKPLVIEIILQGCQAVAVDHLPVYRNQAPYRELSAYGGGKAEVDVAWDFECPSKASLRNC